MLQRFGTQLITNGEVRVKINVERHAPSVRVALVGAAIAIGVMASMGTSQLADPGQAPTVEQHAVGESPATVHLVDRMLKASETRELVRAITSIRDTGWWRTAAGASPSGATATVVVVAGARIRTQPVNGSVIGLIPRGDWFFVQCKRRASDGYVWGYGHHNGRWGWVRDDLWDVIYGTAPGASAPRPIPWC
jgi:hypothetical protein